MKTNEMYEAPVVEVIEVEVEKGFSESGNAPIWDDGYHFGTF